MTIAVVLLLVLMAAQAWAGSIDDIRRALERSSVTQVQEKVYVHTDNQCYFVGDTLWYKAYVVRADDLRPTDMSRLLYVELLSPDGLLVERQTVIVSGSGYTCGQFALKDSLYSGYYELRAYTRWMLNFGVSEHRFSRDESWWFYNRQMASDFFRVWDGLYSRVLPVYSKPERAGDYDVRRMYQRPKSRLPRQKKDDLVVTFYPEGGHLVAGVENRVAFDVTDQHGEAVDIAGRVEADDVAAVDIKTEYMGRGTFMVTPGNKRLKAHFSFRGKDYTTDLPKAESQGVALRLDGNELRVASRNLPADKEYGVSVLCRGVLKYFARLDADHLQLPLAELPTGVADVTLFDSDGRIWADRLFFVNNHEHDDGLITANIERTRTYAPYETVSVDVQLPQVAEPTVFSLSIRDTNTDEPSYDDGNLMTTLLLSSELRGFVAYPAHYFEADDVEHRRHLDLLMLVQGWRRYNWQELAQGERPMRYQPEKTLTVEGAVYRMLNINSVEPEEIEGWNKGVGMVARQMQEDEFVDDPFTDADAGTEENVYALVPDIMVNDLMGSSVVTDIATDGDYGSLEMGRMGSTNDHLGVNHGNLRREVLVEAEVALDGQIVGSVQKTKGGRFLFEVPPFYGNAYMNMKAYKESDSIVKSMSSRKDRKMLDESAFADFYVKRDLFFPMFTNDYSYYQKHQPELDMEMLIDTLSALSMENEVHQLGNVNVKGHRRGRRAIDYSKPAFVMDAYDLYNDITDYGLSFGKFDMRQFPLQVCKFLYGNMNRYRMYNVDCRLEGAVFYRNYSPFSDPKSEVQQASLFQANRTPQWYMEQLQLKRLQSVRVFSDYEPRTEDSLMVEERYSADATVDLVLIPDDAKQPTFRDRHFLLHGVNVSEAFYQPDYRRQQPAEPTDYRRTLYWNPNAVTDAEGRFTATFFNNSKETRISMSAAGVTPDGRLLHSE